MKTPQRQKSYIDGRWRLMYFDKTLCGIQNQWGQSLHTVGMNKVACEKLAHILNKEVKLKFK